MARMKFTFTEKKNKVSDELRDYAEKKIGKLERFFKIESEAYVTFAYERGRHKVEVTINNNGMFYRVTEATSDIFASIDSAVAKIESQIRKHKTRLAKRLREGSTDVDTRAFTLDGGAEMNLLEHTFFVFRNSEKDDAFSVVYARKDGGYGLIEGE
jgi:putative sigma-54 modulation protein